MPNEKIDGFRDIMIQLIRNSIKHGIEDKSDRSNAGKMMRGSITIDLDRPEEEMLRVIYKDDGKGLDLDQIKKHAVEIDLISDFEAEKLDDAGAINLIYTEGFSTSQEVDEHAGRGQGMNLVKNLVEGMAGTLETSFEEGKYFQLIITLPVSGSITEEPEVDETANS